MTIAEHCLCPLVPPEAPFTHEAEFIFYENRNRKTGKGIVHCQNGLIPEDEYYLWGLLGTAFGLPDANGSVLAGPRYLLRQLGLSEGGSNILNLRKVIRRLGHVHYENRHFWDHARKERRDVGFGFLSYDLPEREDSNRPWHIAIDPIFFEFCKTSGGFLAFDLQTTKKLRPASRRLFVFLKKLLYQNKTSTRFDVKHLCVNVLGVSHGLRSADYNRKLFECGKDLAKLGFIDLPAGGQRGLCVKVPGTTGQFTVQFTRGEHFKAEPNVKTRCSELDQPVFELLQRVGFDDACIVATMRKYDHRLINKWADVAIAGIEAGREFKRSPMAFCMESLQADVERGRGVPDWFHDLNRERDHHDWAQTVKARRKLGIGSTSEPKSDGDSFEEYLVGEARAEYVQLVQTMFGEYSKNEYATPAKARKEAVQFARSFLRRKHGDRKRVDGPERIGSHLLRAK